MRPIQSVLRISEDEKMRGAPQDETVKAGAELFERFGFLLIEGALDPRLVEELQKSYFERYASLSRETLNQSSLQVGDERYMITVEINQPFNSPLLYANPFFYPILQRLLGPKLVLNSFGSVCAFPGSRDQHVHLDHEWLFESPISAMVPAYAITVVIGLVDIDLDVGTTAVWEGSHRGGQPKKLAKEDAAFPTTKLGDVYFMDYRLVHGGTANNTARARPIMYLVYSRPWFRDAANYGKQPRIMISSEEFGKIPEAYKPLFRLLHSS
jgi:hypothetical protein